MDENLESFLKQKFVNEYRRSFDEVRPIIEK